MQENENNWSLEDLEKIIQSRKIEKPEGSYVASLFRAGTKRIAKKVGEESGELSLAATRFKDGSEVRENVIGEAADLQVHSLILLAQFDIPYLSIREELTRRYMEKTLTFDGTYRIAQNLFEQSDEIVWTAAELEFTGMGRESLVTGVSDLWFSSELLLESVGISEDEVVEELRIRNVEKTPKGGE